jgi:L-alanine-DL-glutamate epimerase-like enolase superfamily enzyme
MDSRSIEISTIDFDFQTYHYRAPMKFGGMVVDQVTLLNVHCAVRDCNGRTASGFGSMPMGNVWAFPSKRLNYDQTLFAMRQMVDDLASLWRQAGQMLHPIELGVAMEPRIMQVASDTTAALRLTEPIPALCALVASSPFDAAVHDAFGKLHRCSTYELYGSDCLTTDLGKFLGVEFNGLMLDQFVNQKPRATLPLYHLVGALDPIDPPEYLIGDGLPEHLAEWIHRDGLSHLKIKLDGRDLRWDAQRLLDVQRAANATSTQRDWKYSLDFNERCESPDYVREFIAKVRETCPAALDRVQYIEQPTSRDLESHCDQRYHDISKQIPVVIDEALLGLESLMLARELGYSGCALKACKGQTQSLLMGAAAQKLGMFLCVQDLTCPGASLIQSAGLAAHLPGVAAIEANARQYVPAANAEWADRFPGIFRPTSGELETGILTGAGLGAMP